jgi:hypothetical protein
MMDLTTLVEWEAEMNPALQNLCLTTLGAALRQEEKAL